MNREMNTPLGPRKYAPLSDLGDLSSIPYSIRVLLEAVLRKRDGRIVTDEHVEALAKYDARNVPEAEIPFMPGRVILQDFTGVPAVVDLAAMRDAIQRLGGKPEKVNPLIPCDLVIDHSVQVDAFANGMALQINAELEFQRNRERYEFLKWGQQAFQNFRVVPPATGIVHQVNLEYLAKVVWDDGETLYPDSLVGTDSHTTMINGLGVLGWGVGGIEAEACMLGQPIYMLIPEVVGFRLEGRLREGATATDLVLTVTQMLREHGVVGKFVEFYGPGLDAMSVADRATLANMAPEYGATVGFFPVDDKTLEYLWLTGRDEKHIQMVEQYCKAQGLWRDDSHPIVYSSTLSLNLEDVEPSLAGPRRPQDRIPLTKMKDQWLKDLETTFSRPVRRTPPPGRWLAEGGSADAPVALAESEAGGGVEVRGQGYRLFDGDVVIAAITSCTNTSNPSVMVAAGLVARKAHERGLTRQPWVKTSLAPGSKVVTEYLSKSGLLDDLEALGFFVVGYGCTTCIGNSGPLPEEIAEAIKEGDLVVASVLSGNRNFEGRINPYVRANYLASPPLVVAYAIAGTVNIDLMNEPLGTDREGNAVYLRDIWPSLEEIQDVMAKHVTREDFIRQYANVFEGSEQWKQIETSGGSLYDWKEESTYIQNPPFFQDMTLEVRPIQPILGARCLVKLGDSVTTDHISPAGAISPDSPAGKYLIEKGVQPKDFNSYGSRRGNDRVMTRGTFANIRVRNELAPGTEGGWTTDFTDGQVKTIYEASLSYKERGIPLIVLAGKDYGMGSSRDWAAKGTFLLGIRAVIAESFERIHRSNLVGMGVLPLTFAEGQNASSLGLTGREVYDIPVQDDVQPRQTIEVTATREDGTKVSFPCVVRLDTDVEVEYYRNGGILHTVLRKMATE
ncbi:MAG: aconitate hydratase AcnA [Armatimonadetes bacterium]|nr:MAG: aconitate hydratase AcnA [Armatimonadota bacterium]